MIACNKAVIVLIIVLAVLFFLFCPLLAGEVHSTGKGYFNNSPLNEVLKEGEASVWYLGHSGWAVKTKNHLLIFDYSPMGSKSTELSISNGYVIPSEIKDQNVFVFVSHAHADHYDPEILDWENSIENITYIFGWKLREHLKSKIYIVEPRENKRVGGLEILSIYHEFDGIPESAFLLKVDGLVIFHSGDHGSTGEVLNPVFKDNIDFLAKNANGIDIAFISQFGSKKGDAVNRGDLYTIEKLKPRVTFPMHRGGGERLYKKFAQEATENGAKTKFYCAEKRGDRYFYQSNKMK